MDQKQSFNAIDNALLTLWSIGAIIAILLVVAIFRIGLNNIKDIAPLIGAFAILVSAGIASMSVMKSIHTTQQNEKQKAAKEKERKEAFVLNVVETIHLISASVPTDLADGDILNVKNNANTQIDAMSRLLDLVFIENVVSYLNREQQIFLAELHRAFYTYKSKPLPQGANAGVLFEAAYLFQVIQEMMKKVNEISERYIIIFKKDDV